MTEAATVPRSTSNSSLLADDRLKDIDETDAPSSPSGSVSGETPSMETTGSPTGNDAPRNSPLQWTRRPRMAIDAIRQTKEALKEEFPPKLLKKQLSKLSTTRRTRQASPETPSRQQHLPQELPLETGADEASKQQQQQHEEDQAQPRRRSLREFSSAVVASPKNRIRALGSSAKQRAQATKTYQRASVLKARVATKLEELPDTSFPKTAWDKVSTARETLSSRASAAKETLASHGSRPTNLLRKRSVSPRASSDSPPSSPTASPSKSPSSSSSKSLPRSSSLPRMSSWSSSSRSTSQSSATAAEPGVVTKSNSNRTLSKLSSKRALLAEQIRSVGKRGYETVTISDEDDHQAFLMGGSSRYVDAYYDDDEDVIDQHNYNDSWENRILFELWTVLGAIVASLWQLLEVFVPQPKARIRENAHQD